MSKFQTISTVLSVIALTALPVVAWVVVMYRELEATGAMIAAFA